MSLEAALQEHTAVMRELLARLSPSTTAIAMTGSEYVAQIDAEAAAEVKLPTTAKEAVAAAKASAAAAAVSVKKSAEKVQESAAKVHAATEAAAEAAAALDYEKDVRPLLVKVSTGKGRDALVALLKDFGATKGDQLKADQLEAVVAAANELLGA